jgi:hypothetical protein
MAFAAAAAKARTDCGRDEREQVSEHGNEREQADQERRARHERSRSAARSAARERAPNDGARTGRREERPGGRGDGTRPLLEQETCARTGSNSYGPGEARIAEHSLRENTERGAQTRRDADPVPRTQGRQSNYGVCLDGRAGIDIHPSICGPGNRRNSDVTNDARPLLVFFTSARSGPARRMESLLAHLARKERTRLRTTMVDVDTCPELARKFKVDEVPTLVLVKGKKPVARLEGRASAPKIEEMLEPHLPEQALTAA